MHKVRASPSPHNLVVVRSSQFTSNNFKFLLKDRVKEKESKVASQRQIDR